MNAFKRVGAALALIGALVATPASASARDGSRSLCVGSAAGCLTTIQAAVKAAHQGDVIHVEAGTFAGGITIAKTLKLVGAGARATTIGGGGPVLTIGRRSGRRQPTVAISGVTVTGGKTTSDVARRCGPDIPSCGPGYVAATALGGGIEILRGAKVTISDAIVAGNRVAPTKAVPSVIATCPTGACPFAQAAGAGIDNWGTLTLTNTTVSDNEAAGGVTAQADGGGIVSETRSRLALSHSTVTDNRVAVSSPNGRLAAGGGIYVDSNASALTVRDSVISGNQATLSSTYPDSVDDMNANAGGINVGDDVSTTIVNTTISGNEVSVTDLAGQPVGFDPGIIVGKSPLVLQDSSVVNNSLNVTVGTSGEGGSGGGLEADGYATISNTRVTGNSVTVTSPSGVAEAVAVVNMFDGEGRAAVIRDSVIGGNSVTASSTTGSALILGGGLANNGPLELVNVEISGNTATATAPSGSARGGGIFNGLVFPRPTPKLTLRNSVVSDNAIAASPGVSVQGGGLFTTFPLTLDASRITGNAPDECEGC